MTKRFSNANRIRVVIFLLLISSLVTILRLIDIQLIKGQAFEELADANRSFTQLVPRERGLLLDRYGSTLVVNQPLYYKNENSDRLFSERQLIDRAEALQVMATNEAAITQEIRRQYLLGPAGAHVLGYTGQVTADDLKKDKDLLTTDLIGKQGLEKVFDTVLRGRAGKEIYEINALGKKQRLLQSVNGVPGASLQTTIDPYLTYVAQQALGNKTGAVVVLDASNGEVLALVTAPGFDPSILSERYSDPQKEAERKNAVQAAFNHPKQLFFNRAVSGAYPPGSVFKLVTAAAGLSSNALDPSTTVLDEGVLKVGEYSYANWYFTQYGRVEGEISLRKAIARSNDIYFYKAAEWIGPSKLAEIAKEFGFGKTTGVETQSEAAGTVPDPAWKEETLGERWFLGNTYHYGIGQGNLLVTPIQVAQMTQAVAARGSLCQPHIIKQPRTECTGLPVTDEHLSIIVEGMIDACSPGGTAFPFFPWNGAQAGQSEKPYDAVGKGMIACKTGTAEFGVTDSRGYKKTHGWFTMFVGSDDFLQSGSDATASAAVIASTSSESAQLADSRYPERFFDHVAWRALVKEKKFPEKIVITVLVESDEAQPYKEGSRDAAPVAKAVLDWMRIGLQPGEQAPAVVAPQDALAE